MTRFALSWIGGLAVIAAFACTTAQLATPSGETKLGAEAAAEVEQQVGLVHTPALESYVAAIGERLIHDSPVRSGITYQVHVVDMIEPNAFALPGGFVYVSRGLLALLNSEDELANVIAHEVGHVSARHHLQHALRQTPFIPVRLAAGIGGLATSIVSPGLGRLVGAIGDAPGSLYIASHSRGQEDEADEIGQQLVAAAGWDPRGMTTVMDALSRELELAGRDPNQRSFFDTHPTTPSRSRRTLERAASLKVVAQAPIASDRRGFYEKLDGLLYGDPASNGVVVGSEFMHPDLDVRVAFPDAWQIENGAESVVAAPKERDALAAFAIAAEGDDPVAVAKQVIKKSSLEVDGSIENATIGGRPAARAAVRSRESLTHYRHLVGWVSQGGYVYQVSGSTLEKDWAKYGDAFAKLVGSFRPLTASDRERVHEARLRVVYAKTGEDLKTLLTRVNSAWSPERAAASNGFGAQAALRAGQPVKVARWEIYSGEAQDR